MLQALAGALAAFYRLPVETLSDSGRRFVHRRWQKPQAWPRLCRLGSPLPCTFWLYLKPWLFEINVLRPQANMRLWEALSISPPAGCSTRSQSLWALWATLSARLILLLSSRLNSAIRRQHRALPALRVAREGPAPPPELAVDARPVGSCAARASTGAMKHQSAPMIDGRESLCYGL